MKEAYKRKVYKAVLHNDRVKWLKGAPDADEPVPVHIILDKEKHEYIQSRTMLQNDTVKWLDAPPEINGPVQTYIILLNHPKVDHPDNRGLIGVAMLEILADRGTFDHIEDPVAWQREQRKDRPMPFRDYIP